MPTIQKVDSLPKGTRLEVCPQATPAGMVAQATAHAQDVVVKAQEVVQMPTIQRIDSLPSGTTLQICPSATPPRVVTGYAACAGCCGKQ